nr:protein IMPACT-like [Onthophagus taurus]
MDSVIQQKEEVEALEAIYGDEWKREESDKSFSISINKDVQLYINLSEKYPLESPPTYVLRAPTLDGETKRKIANAFEDIYLENIGGPVIYQWIECLRENVQIEKCKENNDQNEVETVIVKEIEELKVFDIIHGECISDRKSTFQGHFCVVHSQEDIRHVLNQLYENKKIAQATHNISAFRIKNESVLTQDCDDDGESHAGGRLLHLLQILDVINGIVVVSRWYGGIHLGPDRFRHINNAARQVLEQAGIVQKTTLK